MYCNNVSQLLREGLLMNTILKEIVMTSQLNGLLKILFALTKRLSSESLTFLLRMRKKDTPKQNLI